MEITQQKLDELKSQIQIKEPLGALIQNSLVVGEKPDDERIAASAASDDCQSFNFDIKLLKISGSICKTGMIDFRGSVCGIEIAHTTADLSKHEICWHPKLGKLLGIKFCFALENHCLYTRGEIDGWFKTLVKWNEKIFCF